MKYWYNDNTLLFGEGRNGNNTPVAFFTPNMKEQDKAEMVALLNFALEAEAK